MLISVDLPAPFSPSSACTSPARTSRSMRSLATTPGNTLVIPRSSTSGGGCVPGRISLSAATIRAGGRAAGRLSPGPAAGMSLALAIRSSTWALSSVSGTSISPSMICSWCPPARLHVCVVDVIGLEQRDAIVLEVERVVVLAERAGRRCRRAPDCTGRRSSRAPRRAGCPARRSWSCRRSRR